MNGRQVFIWGSGLLILIGTGVSLIGGKGWFLIWLIGQRSPELDYFFYYITELGEPIGFTIIGVLLWLSSWRKMIGIPILGGIVTVVSYVLKRVFYHERPIHFLERIGWEGPVQVLDYQVLINHKSFPSGHSMAAWALFTFTALMIRNVWVSLVCLILGVAVSISRVYLVAHFLKDVVAGAVIGFMLGYMAYLSYVKWTERQALKKGLSPRPPV